MSDTVRACFVLAVLLGAGGAAPAAPLVRAQAVFKGQADVDYTKPVQTRDYNKVVTTLMVKNNAGGALERLTVGETWHDAAGGILTAGEGVVPRLEAGAVAMIKIETPFSAKAKTNSYTFRHANGSVRPHQVATLAAAGAGTKHKKK